MGCQVQPVVNLTKEMGCRYIEQGLGRGKESGGGESVVVDYTLGFAWEDGKEAPMRVERTGQIRGVGVTCSRHSCVCAKPLITWLRQNLVGTARTELSPCLS